MKSILIVMTSLYNGGAEKSLINFLNELDYTRYSVDLLLFKKQGMFLSQVPTNVNILDTPVDIKKLYSDNLKFNRLAPIKIVGTIVSKLVSSEYDIMRGFRWKHFYSSHIKAIKKHYNIAISYISGEVMYFVGEKVKADKKIAVIHSDYRASKFPKKYDYLHLKNANKITTISDKCADILKEEFPEFFDKIYMLPNLTSSKVIKKRAKEFYPIEFNDAKNIILSVGRLSIEKGFDMAVETAHILKEKNICFKWFVIGNGNMEEKIRKKINEYKLENSFILLGVRENPYPYILNCDLFVQPSRFEGKSVVLDEAKILARPIVATAYPTVRDQISEEEGQVVRMSPQGIAEGILSMMDTKMRQKYTEYLCSKEYGNHNDIKLYYDVIDN